MHVVRGTDRWGRTGLRGPVVTIGNFDGVHRGHREVIGVARRVGERHAAPVVALTFDPAPRDVLRPDNPIPRIQTLERKLHHLEACGLDAVIVQPFDLTLAALPPEGFVERLLEGDLGARAVVVGHDFRFGRGRSGTLADLEARGLEAHAVPALTDDGRPVSSSRIREALRAGDVDEAARLLGRPHEVVGQVVPGDRRGRTLGFPTANVRPEGGLLPPAGVYAVRVDLEDGHQRPGVANLGTRPTFDGVEVLLEVHLLDFDGDLYGRRAVVGLIARLREERRFDGPEALIAAVRADVERARRLLA